MSGIVVHNSQLEKLAEIYSLIISIDHVERAYMRNTIAASDYNDVMSRLLSQYSKLVKEEDVEASYGDLDSFVKAFKIASPSGVQRIKVGILATAEALDVPGDLNSRSKTQLSTSKVPVEGGKGKAIAETTAHFITFCDGINLGLRGKDDLHPLLAELVTSLNRVTKANFDGRGKFVEWLIRLNQLKGRETLTDEELKRCLDDIQYGYRSYSALLD